MTPDWDRRLAALARKQHGVVHCDQLTKFGLTPAAIRHRLDCGRLHPLHRGVYAVGFEPGRRGHWLAATMACGPEAVLSHASLAALLELRRSSSALIDVTAPTRAGRLRDGIRVHGAATLREVDRDEVDGIPCTTVARLIVDMAGALGPGALEYLIHRAQTKRKLDRAAVVDVIDHAPKRRGTANLRRILGLTSASEDELRSENERRPYRLCRSAGLPLPRCNRWIAVEGAAAGGFEVDFCWAERRLIVEVDTRGLHDSERAFENDRYRDRLLTLAGWTVVRITRRDLLERPDEVARQLRALLLRHPWPVNAALRR